MIKTITAAVVDRAQRVRSLVQPKGTDRQVTEAQVQDPQTLGLVTFGIDQMRDPPHVLEIEHRGIRDVHVGTGHSVDLDDPTVIGVLIADKLARPGIDGESAGDGTGLASLGSTAASSGLASSLGHCVHVSRAPFW